MMRAELLATLAARISALSLDHPIRVGIDGCDAAGKTTLANELASALAACGKSVLLEPLGPNGSRACRRAVFDFRTDLPVQAPLETAPEDAVLIFEGVFLHRDELASFWDFSVFLDVDFETAIRRAEARDLELFGTVAEVRARYEQRYVPGQKLYFARCDPKRRATLVIANADPNRPAIVGAE